MTKRKDPIKTNIMSDSSSSNAFVTFNPEKPEEAANAIANSKALNMYQAVAYGGGRDRFEDVSTNISVRNEFTREDYDTYRSAEARPIKSKAVMSSCNNAYKKVGIVRNVIDLMADFGSQGVKLVHENKKIQRFSQRWFTHKVDGEKTTERFLNYLYRIGTVVSQRQLCKISLSEERILSIAGKNDIILEPTHEQKPALKVKKRVIPCGYSFLNPLTLEVAGGELAQFAGEQAYGLKLTGALRSKITAPKNDLEKALIEKLPKELVEAVTKGINVLPLDNSKISSFSYKKDDWDVWASPMLECILDDLTLLEKMKLADLAALDGAISQIRIWRLGDLDKGILPTDAAIQKLADILLSNPGGGAFDLIWGPELTFEEVTTSVHNFLGGTKYEPILDSIFSGLGVPPTLTGSSRVGGASNNFISLQTLVQRLEYGRQQVTKFWQAELELLRQSMGWSKAPSVQFDHMILKDEAAEKALLIQLLDRNLISEELVVEMFGAVPELENSRKRRERKERESGKRAPKSGPYDKDKIHDLIKIALGRGFISPEQAGLLLEEDDNPSPFDKQMEKKNEAAPAPQEEADKGVPGEGRPKNSKDEPGTNRDRQFNPRSANAIASDIGDFLNHMSWAKKTQAEISTVITPGLLKHYGKKNMRSLSSKECLNAESVKFKILANIPKHSIVDEKTVFEIVAKNTELPESFKKCYNSLMEAHSKNAGRAPTIEEIRNIQAATYAICS
tara:strand:- start:967 stop:3165 length:2199 start_codon:yes stop_codon:yes gene_type:complete